MGWKDRDAHRSKASPEKATGTAQYPVSPMARELLSGTLLHTPRGCKADRGGWGGTDYEQKWDEKEGCSRAGESGVGGDRSYLAR